MLLSINFKIILTLSTLEPFFYLFFKYRKFDIVTQFLRNGSTELQSVVYHFVRNFNLLHENVKKNSTFDTYPAGKIAKK